jgi:hypothetical protein
VDDHPGLRLDALNLAQDQGIDLQDLAVLLADHLSLEHQDRDILRGRLACGGVHPLQGIEYEGESAMLDHGIEDQGRPRPEDGEGDHWTPQYLIASILPHEALGGPLPQLLTDLLHQDLVVR